MYLLECTVVMQGHTARTDCKRAANMQPNASLVLGTCHSVETATSKVWLSTAVDLACELDHACLLDLACLFFFTGVPANARYLLWHADVDQALFLHSILLVQGQAGSPCFALIRRVLGQNT